MPITYQIDPGLRLVTAQYTGEISIQEARDFIEKVVKDPAFDSEFRLLAIVSGANINATGSDFRQFEEWRKGLPAYKQIAFVASTDFEFGILRQYELVTNEVGSKHMRIFRSLKLAREWLGLPEP